MQTARVTPRNIQFQEEVEIREIPRRQSEESVPFNLNKEQEVWDPKLSHTELFKPQPNNILKKFLIGIIVGGITIAAVVCGIVLGIALSQKTTTVADNSLSYGSVCTTGSNQCISSQGLICSNGFCTCSSPYSWNTATTTCTLLTYNQACTLSNQCDSSLGLNCTNNVCQCDSYHSWNSVNNICTTILNHTLSYGATCVNGSNQCNISADLICTGNCTCQNSKVWNISNCVCPPGTFLNSSNLCQSAYSLNHTCTIGSNQCDSTKDLLCNNSICQCDYSIKYWNINFQTCMNRLNYTDLCVHDSDCLPTLICPTVSGVCNCSQYLPDLVCNCENTKYYDPNLLQCVNRATFGGTCLTSANYTCLISLYCNAGQCACPTGTSWISANTSCIATG